MIKTLIRLQWSLGHHLHNKKLSLCCSLKHEENTWEVVDQDHVKNADASWLKGVTHTCLVLTGKCDGKLHESEVADSMHAKVHLLQHFFFQINRMLD